MIENKNIGKSGGSKYYIELVKYYKLKDKYFDADVEMTDKEEDELCQQLIDQENKVIDMLYDLMEGKVNKSTIKHMMVAYRDRLYNIVRKLVFKF